MLYSLSGTVRKLEVPLVTVEVSGIGYLLTVPHPVWDELKEGQESTLIVYTYVREDRLDLFGFRMKEDRTLFSELLNLSGIGPKIALELCSIPKALLFQAAQHDDSGILTKIKGIGKKTAEKLLVDLRQLLEKHPEWALVKVSRPGEAVAASFDDDAIQALVSLGYDRSSILEALRKVPASVVKTEERVAAVLRAL